MNQIEYRVREVTRFIVTRYETEPPKSASASRGISSQIGEYASGETAYEVAYALARAEAAALDLPPGDMGVIFPSPINGNARPPGSEPAVIT